jgi:hypothetical protein
MLFSHLLYKNTETKIQEIISLPVALYGCETRSIKITEKH